MDIFQNVATKQCLKWVLLSWQLPLKPQEASYYFPPPPPQDLVELRCNWTIIVTAYDLKLTQISKFLDPEGDLRCHSFCQSFLITEDDWLGHGSCPDNTASAFRAAKANRYTVMYLASDTFQPHISKSKNGFFIRFQHPIESIYMNGWVKSSGLKKLFPPKTVLSLAALTSVLLYWASVNTPELSWTSFVNDPTKIPSHRLRRLEKLRLKVADLWNYSRKQLLGFFSSCCFFWGQDLNLNLIRSYRRSYSPGTQQSIN